MNANVERGLEVLLRNIQRIHSNIQFADRKAGALMAVDSALLAVIQPLVSRQTSPVGCFVTALAAAGFLILAVIAGFSVIRPRGNQNRKRGPGVVDQDRVALHGDALDFVEEVSAKTSDAIFGEFQTLLYDLACIDRTKYWYLRRLVVPLSALGGLLAIIALLWNRF